MIDRKVYSDEGEKRNQQDSKEGVVPLPPDPNYHNDYSPRYQKPYDIYEKARSHMRKLRRMNQLYKS